MEKMKQQFMDINRETAMRLWNKSFGKESKVKDFTGRMMAKGAYNDRNSEFGWNVDHILPQSKGGVTADHNLVCCHILTNDEKADKFPCFKANGILFEIIKVQNHYEIRPKNGTNVNPFVNKVDEDFYDSAAGIRRFKLLQRHQNEERFVGTVFVTLKNVNDAALFDFIQILMETEDFSCKCNDNSYGKLLDAEIIIRGDFLPTQDDTQAMLDKCILLNTYLQHYFLPKNIVSGYKISYRLDCYESSAHMYKKMSVVPSHNSVGYYSVGYTTIENKLYINKLVWQNTEAKNNMDWNTNYGDYNEYDYYYTNLAKYLDKEVSGK